MTEDRWNASSDPREMLKLLRKRSRKKFARKFRRFACECAQRVRGYLSDAAEFEALVVADCFAEGTATPDDLAVARNSAEKIGSEWCDASIAVCLQDAWEAASEASGSAVTAEVCAVELTIASSGPIDYIGTPEAAAAKERGAQAKLLRDILGNPFRPVAFDAEWGTSTVVALAQQMYESRDFSAMPILADALQDAGCDNDDILTHCRDANGVHVRGCWVVDLILGKE